MRNGFTGSGRTRAGDADGGNHGPGSGMTERVRDPSQADGRRRPVGAEVRPEGGVDFRVWAPKHRAVEVVFEGGSTPPGPLALRPVEGGYFAGSAPGASPGSLYRFRVGGELRADPASRFQPEGPAGPSQVIDPGAFRWTDGGWRGPGSPEGQVLYELHAGTFTPEGTWASAADRLDDVADLGVTAVELMPVAEFPGKFGWSYDGVNLFAPFHGYGTPDDFRRFVDRAHGLGLAVLLDVVFNHLGPEANPLKAYSDDYFSKRHVTEWGEALNFDGENAGPVREFVLANAASWVDEYHVDGLRVDATQSLFDCAEGHGHIVAEIARTVRESARRRGCRALVVGESEQQRGRIFRPSDRGGLGYDMLWSDDFHHASMVAATGNRGGYYGDYLGTPQELVSALKRGWLYQGQWDLRQSKRRGSPALDVPPRAFIHYLQNHDQVANSARGDRFHASTSPGRFRALTALLLLGPATPLIFQGQEYAASTPFLYFGDLGPPFCDEMRASRRSFLTQFPGLATGAMQAAVPHPADPSVFARSKLDPSERHEGRHAEALALHRDLIRLRRDDPTFRGGRRPGAVDGAVLGPEAFVARWFDPDGNGDDRLLLVNLGAELRLRVAAEPLLAAPEGARWRVLWSTEDPKYGGAGTPSPETERDNWTLTGQAATALAPEPATVDEFRNFEGTV